MFKADSIEELASNIGMDEKALMAQVSRVNQFTKAGNVQESNHRGGLVTIMRPPFYMLVAKKYGGLMTHIRVLDTKGKVIAELFAAGEVTGMTHGSNRRGGNAITDITVFGRIAAKEAAAQ
jgi:urocanate reductase